MSIESPITEKDNWFIGADMLIDFYITTSPRVTAKVEAALNATAITLVNPLSEALASGDKVRFAVQGEAGVVATLTAAAVAGATSLIVSAISGIIPANTPGG